MKKKFKLKGDCITDEVWLDGKLLDLDKSLKVRSHSPTGFSWGYAGSGCSQLALAICCELLGNVEALKVYQRFKADILAKMVFGDNFEEVITYDFNGVNNERYHCR